VFHPLLRSHHVSMALVLGTSSTFLERKRCTADRAQSRLVLRCHSSGAGDGTVERDAFEVATYGKQLASSATRCWVFRAEVP